jgi:hypothetical protein
MSKSSLTILIFANLELLVVTKLVCFHLVARVGGVKFIITSGCIYAYTGPMYTFCS